MSKTRFFVLLVMMTSALSSGALLTYLLHRVHWVDSFAKQEALEIEEGWIELPAKPKAPEPQRMLEPLLPPETREAGVQYAKEMLDETMPPSNLIPSGCLLTEHDTTQQTEVQTAEDGKPGSPTDGEDRRAAILFGLDNPVQFVGTNGASDSLRDTCVAQTAQVTADNCSSDPAAKDDKPCCTTGTCMKLPVQKCSNVPAGSPPPPWGPMPPYWAMPPMPMPAPPQGGGYPLPPPPMPPPMPPPSMRGAVLPYTGTHECTLKDAELVLPEPVLKQLDLGDDDVLFLVPGPDQCLAIHTSPSLEALVEKLEKVQGGDENHRFRRLLFSRIERIEPDGAGKIKLPKRLSEYAGVKEKAVIIGVGDHFELWDVECWEQYNTNGKPPTCKNVMPAVEVVQLAEMDLFVPFYYGHKVEPKVRVKEPGQPFVSFGNFH